MNKNKNSNQAKSDKNTRSHSKPRQSYRNSASKRYDKKEFSSNPLDETRQATNYAKQQAVSNDPAWYATDPALARDSAAIPFSWSTGTTSSLRNSNPLPAGDNPTSELYSFAAPGICVLRLLSTMGASDSPTSPINVAATAVYSYVRHANSGHANYDSPDLMMYIIAMGEIISYANFLIRAYGVASLYSSRNRYFPDELLKAMQIDPADVRSNYAQFRYGINLLMNKVSSLAVPSNMSYFKRKAFLYTGLYTEGTSAKDQVYMYTPKGFYFLSTDADGATALDIRTITEYPNMQPGELRTVAELLQILDDMVSPMIMSEDMNIMSGDILKAYGTSGILKFAEVAENYSVAPQFDIGVLSQMKNATVLSERMTTQITTTQNGIRQDPDKGYIVTDSAITLTQTNSLQGFEPMLFGLNRILTTTTSEVDPGLVLESTRLMPAFVVSINAAQATEVDLVIYGATELCTDCDIITAAYTTAAAGDFISRSVYSYIATSSSSALSGTAATNVLYALAAKAAFKFAPDVYWYIGSGSSLQAQFKFLQFDNYAVLTPEDLQRMHEACLLNMLHVPAIGSALSS